VVPFLVPDDFRAFLQEVVAYVDGPEDDKLLDAEDAFHHECGHGGRVERLGDGASIYAFTYIESSGQAKWEVLLAEPQMREIADGLLIEVPAERLDLVKTKHRTPSGEPLLIWGEYGDDALVITGAEMLQKALDGLHTASFDQPRLVRMWSAADDQLVAVLAGDECALYVVESVEGYATACGDPARTDTITLSDPDGGDFVVPGCDLISWEVARTGFATFLEEGDLGSAIPVEGRIPSALLMMGDIDRKEALASRQEPARTVERSSVNRLATPVPVDVDEVDDATAPVELETHMRAEELAAWAKRFLELLAERELLEPVQTGNRDEVYYQVGGLLAAHAREAQDSVDTADFLANELSQIRHVGQLFATGGDLQVVLRRSRP